MSMTDKQCEKAFKYKKVCVCGRKSYCNKPIPEKGICPRCSHGRNPKLIEKLEKLHGIS